MKPNYGEIEDYETQQQRLADEWQANEAAAEFDRECQCNSCQAVRKEIASLQEYSEIF
jgi:hypothetical protein